MADQIFVHLTVNGKEFEAQTTPDQTLMDFLRRELRLTGTKNGCAQQHTGTCTVIVNGQAERSCQYPMRQAAGAVVETIESIAPAPGKLHPLQYAFIAEHAVQCGFCTPGMILAAKALLDQNPDPSDDQIRHALRDNLCRCTGYSAILRAVRHGARLLADGVTAVDAPTPAAADQPARPANGDGLMGVSYLDGHGVDGVTGRILFGDDRSMPGMLYGKVRWAGVASARIISIDSAPAYAVPGVRLVLTAQDVPGVNKVGMVKRDQPAIAERVRYAGDALAVVYAESEAAAAAGAAALRVELEPLPGVFSPEEAMAPGAPLVHETGNLCHEAFLKRGDVEAAFRAAAVVTEGTYTTPFVDHGFLEPESGIAYPDGQGGVVLEQGTQTPFEDRQQLSEALGLPKEKIRVRQMPMGGAFGGKEDMLLHFLLCLGALRSGSPVKITLSRDESLQAHPKRHPARMHYKLAADAQGVITAVQAEMAIDTGAYTSLGPDIVENMLTFGAGPYFIPNVDMRCSAWFTNNVYAGAMRGFGVPQVAFALEAEVDKLARALKIDPFEIRLKNALDVGLPLASDHILEASVGIKATLIAARDALDQINLKRDGKRVGVGVACSLKNIGFGHGIPEEAGAEVVLDSSGTFLVRVGVVDFGQGAHMAFRHLAAHELGARFEQVRTEYADTAVSPETGATTASRQTYLSGNAVVLACKEMKSQLFQLAHEELNLPAAELTLRDGRLAHIPSGREFDLANLSVQLTASAKYIAPKTDPFPEAHTSLEGGKLVSRRTHFAYGYGTHVAVVEVDEHTGQTRATHIIAAHDVGRAINPAIIKGQIEGGVMMGLGYGLSEEFVMQEGISQTSTLQQCGIPGFEEAPEILSLYVEDPEPTGPHGVKGMAEVSILPTAAALANAIYDAVGARITALPARPERVLAALRERPA